MILVISPLEHCPKKIHHLSLLGTKPSDVNYLESLKKRVNNGHVLGEVEKDSAIILRFPSDDSPHPKYVRKRFPLNVRQHAFFFSLKKFLTSSLSAETITKYNGLKLVYGGLRIVRKHKPWQKKLYALFKRREIPHPPVKRHEVHADPE